MSLPAITKRGAMPRSASKFAAAMSTSLLKLYHAGQLRVMRRFRNGFAANALYTFSKSIDNASSIGGGGAVVVQDDRNLAAERGLSSFDRRHTLTLSFMFSTSGTPGSAASRSVLLRD